MANEFTFYERQRLEYWLRTKMSIRDIGKLMRRSHSILSREIRRNGINRKKYRADTAHKQWERRKHNKRKGKLDKHPELKKYVIEKIKDDWSPEEISGRLKKEQRSETISHESIYNYIYNRDGRYEGLYYHLRQAQPKRRRKWGRKSRKLRVPERISIHERPEYINERKRFGDWESDSMIFSKQKTALSVQLERKSRIVRIRKLLNKSDEETLDALTKTAESVPKELFLSLTFDNGSENFKHTRCKQEYGIETYFCDPFSSWQKGGVENANKLIRQYLPRKTNLSTLSDQDIYEIQEKLNNRPRKCLDYQTPNEIIKSGALKT